MPTFDIGLVMAGAVSAGAYTAGAVDFLLQALDEWYAARGTSPDVPPHEVRLRVLTGASAGGITAGIVAAVLGEEVPPVDDYPVHSRGAENKLFDAWVNRVDVTGLLGHVDLDRDVGAARSVLDSTVLDEIGGRVFRPGVPRPGPRPYVADPLLVAVTLTNLRGVPYEIDFRGLAGTRMPYVMSLHADQMTFAVGRPRAPAVAAGPGRTTPANAIPLDPRTLGDAAWDTLRLAALASGAFPLGLSPRLLRQVAGEYHRRTFFFPRTRVTDGQTEYGYYDPLPPAWALDPDALYEFLCVDGGTLDNEPVGLARGHLTPHDRTGTRTRGGDTPAALVLVDPFPDDAPFEPAYQAPAGMYAVADRVLRSLINQARFKPDELTRAVDPDVFNQFLLAPVRYAPTGTPVPRNPLASGGLGGFAGFLSRDFRVHDFQLGRLNCQRFLRRHFVLPVTLSDGSRNPLFADWSPAARARYVVRRDADGRVLDAGGLVADRDGTSRPPTGPVTELLPVVPLLGRAAVDERSPDWPGYPRARLPELRGQVNDRATRVVDRMVSTTDGWLTRRLLYTAWRLKRDEILKSEVMAKIESDLASRGLLRG